MRHNDSARQPALLFWLAAAALVALALALPMALWAEGGARSTAMEDWVEAGTRAWHERDFRRPALWGATLPGSAFACYGQATTLTVALRLEDERLLSEVLLHADRVPPEAAVAVRRRWAPAVAAVRDGAHREDARPVADPADGFHVRNQGLMPGRLVVNLMVLDARDLQRAGCGQAAVELLLDAATVGLDLRRSPVFFDQMTGVALLRIATSDAWEDSSLRTLEPAALETLATGLRRLDEMLPVAPLLEGDLLCQANGFLDDDVHEWDSWRTTWRYGLSARWSHADAVMTLAAIVADLRAHEHLPWTRRGALMLQYQEELRGAANPFVANWFGVHVERNVREEMARLRLLRLAVDAHLRRPLAPLADPLGDAALSVVERDGEVWLASAGRQQGTPIERTAVLR